MGWHALLRKIVMSTSTSLCTQIHFRGMGLFQRRICEINFVCLRRSRGSGKGLRGAPPNPRDPGTLPWNELLDQKAADFMVALAPPRRPYYAHPTTRHGLNVVRRDPVCEKTSDSTTSPTPIQ